MALDSHMQPHSAGLAMPHPVTFAQQLMDPNMSQQQLAQYHHQMAHFYPHPHQQYHPGHLQEVPPLYFAQGMPPQLQQYHPQVRLSTIYRDLSAVRGKIRPFTYNQPFQSGNLDVLLTVNPCLVNISESRKVREATALNSLMGHRHAPYHAFACSASQLSRKGGHGLPIL